jgi:hypothetical protein
MRERRVRGWMREEGERVDEGEEGERVDEGKLEAGMYVVGPIIPFKLYFRNFLEILTCSTCGIHLPNQCTGLLQTGEDTQRLAGRVSQQNLMCTQDTSKY